MYEELLFFRKDNFGNIHFIAVIHIEVISDGTTIIIFFLLSSTYTKFSK